MTKPVLSPVIFLDTNAIHNVVSYLLLADQHKLTPFGPINDIGRIKLELEKSAPTEICNFLITGLHILSYLQNQVEENDARVCTSRLTLAEMWYGRLDGQAHIRMSMLGIPYRLRQRQNIINKLVMSQLTHDDYEKVKSELEDLGQNWYERFGIQLDFVEDVANSRDILLLALEIQKLTFIDVIDCILMAGSMAVRASEFITDDGAMFEVMRRIKEPNSISDNGQKALWKSAQKTILEQLKQLHLDKSVVIADIVKPYKASGIRSDPSKLHLIEQEM